MRLSQHFGWWWIFQHRVVNTTFDICVWIRELTVTAGKHIVFHLNKTKQSGWMHSKDINLVYLSITQLYYCKIVLLFSCQNRLNYLAFQNLTFCVPMCLLCAFISKRIWDHFVHKGIYRQVFELIHYYTFQMYVLNLIKIHPFFTKLSHPV